MTRRRKQKRAGFDKKSRKNALPFGEKAEGYPLVDFDELPLLFSFRYIEEKGSCGYGGCSDREFALVFKKLILLSEMNWRQIKGASRQGVGAEKISPKSLRVGIPQIAVGKEILGIRYGDKKRILGFRGVGDEGRLFYILFIDAQRKAYDHSP